MKRLRRSLGAIGGVLRGLWLWLGVVAAVTFCGTLSLPTLAITGDGRFGHRMFAQGWGRFILWWSGVELRVEGRQTLDLERAAVIVANHVSHYGFYAMAAALPLQWRAVMRREMRRIPIFGYVAEKAGHVFIRLGDQKRAREDLQAGLDRLGEGYWLLVFPEGRRGPATGPLPFRMGAFRLAIQAGVPVLPVTLEESYTRGSGPLWNRAPVRLRVCIGRLIDTAGLAPGDAGALAARTRDDIVARLPPR